MHGKNLLYIKAQPLISIITLNWNQTDITLRFLESTRRLRYKNFEVLVCNMSSATDARMQTITQDYRNTRILKTDTFSNNDVNWAVKQAKGDFILLINNHTELTEDALDHLLRPFLNDSLLGVTCPKVRSLDDRAVIQFAGYKSLNKLTGKKSIIGYNKKDNGQYDHPDYMQGVFSGAMMFKKTVIEKAGMLPRNYYKYFDDTDLSNRILKTGFKIFYQPEAVVYSKDMPSESEKTAINVYYNTRNRIVFMRRNAGIYQFFIFIVFFLLITTPIVIGKFLLKGQIYHLQSFFKGVWWNLGRIKILSN